MDNMVWQEFYCRHCPADSPGATDPQASKTGGHFRVKLPTSYDANILLRCPKCGNVHRRHVKGGQIYDNQDSAIRLEETVRVPLAAWSREPVSAVMAKARQRSDNAHQPALRKGAVLDGADALDGDEDNERAQRMRQLWLEYHGDGSG